MANNKACLFAALCSLLIVTSFIGSLESVTCCVKYTKGKIHCRQVEGYSYQTIKGSCDINAIIFYLRGRYVCADPSKEWTKRVVNCLEKGRRKKVIASKTG
ncbi:C-C motif chemokine 20b [Anableps anableps]